ncbi:MAG: hypothetical protein OES79_15105, partial [Planctomycetota bacterium]|nr:hypothetical protein [Planctomycetota bacterium]
MQKFADEVFGGTRFDLPVPINFADGEVYKVKVWSSRLVPVSFKLEETDNPGGGRTIALDHTGSGMWEELCFDFTGQTASIPNPPVTAVTIIFDLGVLGQASSDPDNWTFFYDDITQVSSCTDEPDPGGDPGLLASFDEATPPTVTEFGGASFGIEPGPAGGDGNALRITRDGGEVFAGAWIAISEIPNDEGEQTISALVYSPTAGIPMVTKVEYGDNMGTGDTPANEAVVEGWQTLTWTYTNLEPGNVYNRFTILPNLGTVDTATNYFFDNITLEGVGGGGGDTVLTSFDEATPPTVTEFGGASFGIEFGPAGGEGLSLRITRDGGEVFAGAWIAVPEIPNDAGEQTISALVYSPVAGVPMVTKVEFGDNMGTGDTPANEAVVVGWQTLTWTYTNLAPGNVYNRFTILPNLGTVDSATNYYFDNITLLGADEGPSGTVLGDFDEATPPTVTEFGGASFGIDFGPAGGDGLSLRITRDGGEVFAGAWIAVPEIPNDAGEQTISAL